MKLTKYTILLLSKALFIKIKVLTDLKIPYTSQISTRSLYYMHNKEIWWFLNKLKALITSGLRRFISSKEIIPPGRFYFSNAIVLC